MKSFTAVAISYTTGDLIVHTDHQPSAHTLRAAKDLIAKDLTIESICISRVTPSRIIILEVLTPSSIAPEGR